MTQIQQKALLGVVSLGLAFGVTWALGVFMLGVGAAFFNWGIPVVAVLSSVYAGYGPTFIGSITGAVWGFVDGFIGGALMAWLYNKFVSRHHQAV